MITQIFSSSVLTVCEGRHGKLQFDGCASRTSQKTEIFEQLVSMIRLEASRQVSLARAQQIGHQGHGDDQSQSVQQQIIVQGAVKSCQSGFLRLPNICESSHHLKA